jgi:predicted phage terminase large subunit-like protein
MELTRHDLNLIREALLRNFTIAKLEASGWLDQIPTQKLWKELAEIDIQFFNSFYLPHHFDRTPSPMHLETYSTIQNALLTQGRVNEVVVWPRGHGKTTTVTNSTPLWCALYKKRRFIVIISDSHSQAKQQLTTVKDELENNPRILEDFGPMKGEKWQEDDITLVNRVKILALGSGMKIRGRKHFHTRPDLFVCDDLENLESLKSDLQRESTREWFFRSVTKAGWNDTKIFAVGNFLHFDCLLMHLTENPLFNHKIYKAVTSWAEREDLWDQWEAILTNLDDPRKQHTARAFFLVHKEEMLKGAETIWPEAFPYYDLMVTKVTDGSNTFATELQNDPIDPARQMFKNWGTYRMEYRPGSTLVEAGVWLVPSSGSAAVPLASCVIFGATDPAMAKTAHSDFAAIIILAKAPTRQMFVLEADIVRRPPDLMIAAQNAFAQQYPIVRWRIESNAFQALYATESARSSMEAGVYLPVEAYSQLKNKPLRINSLQPDLENGYILLRETGQDELKKQLREWPMGAHDDGPDALETARTLAREYEPMGGDELIQADTHQFTPSAVKRHRVAVGEDEYAKWDKLADEKLREMAEERGEELPEYEEVFVPVMYY